MRSYTFELYPRGLRCPRQNHNNCISNVQHTIPSLVHSWTVCNITERKKNYKHFVNRYWKSVKKKMYVGMIVRCIGRFDRARTTLVAKERPSVIFSFRTLIPAYLFDIFFFFFNGSKRTSRNPRRLLNPFKRIYLPGVVIVLFMLQADFQRTITCTDTTAVLPL